MLQERAGKTKLFLVKKTEAVTNTGKGTENWHLATEHVLWKTEDQDLYARLTGKENKISEYKSVGGGAVLTHRMWSEHQIEEFQTDTQSEESLGTKCVNQEVSDAVSDTQKGADTEACTCVPDIEVIYTGSLSVERSYIRSLSRHRDSTEGWYRN